MVKPKIYKIITGVLLLIVIAILAVYSQLSNRHRAIVKTTLLHKSGLIDGKWSVDNKLQSYNMISPSFLIDGIYTSMEGPKSSKYVQLSQDSTLLWITGFKVTAIDAKSRRPLSNDFICHTNVDFNDVKYFSGFNLTDRIGKQYPRLTSLSNGMEDFRLVVNPLTLKEDHRIGAQQRRVHESLRVVRCRRKHDLQTRNVRTHAAPILTVLRPVL